MSSKTETAARINKHVEIFIKSLDSYEEEHPDWEVEALLWVIDFSLRNLKHYVDSPKNKNKNWNQFFLSLNYRVEWERNTLGDGDKCRVSLNSGKITGDDVKDNASAVRALSQLLVKHLILITLQNYTNHVAFQKDGKDFVPIISEEIGNEIAKMKRQQRQQFLEELYEPFSMGAVAIDLPKKIKHGMPIPDDIQRGLARSVARMKPPLEFIGNINSKPVKVSVLFQIQPLIMDVRKNKAYFPLSVGIQILPEKHTSKESGDFPEDPPWTNPAKWSSEDRQQFWSQLLEGIESIWKGLARPKAEIKEAIVTLQATFRFPVNMTDPDATNELIRSAVDKFAEHGKIEKLDWQITDSKTLTSMAQGTDQCLSPPATRSELRMSLEKMNRAKSAFDKGKALEELAKGLFATVPGFSVKEHRIHSETEEIDLLVVNSGAQHPWNREQPLVIVECKNWSSKCGKNEFVLFKEKIKNRKGRCSVGILVSWNGFANTVTKEMLRISQENVMIIPVEGRQISEAIENSSFSRILSAGWEQATLI